jgi:hypothetical protein
MKTTLKILTLSIIVFFSSCTKDDNNGNNSSAAGTNYLTMKINGVEWKSDTDGVFGAFHPTGYNDATLISGTIGSGATQQAFNINMFRTIGVGEYVFSNVTENAFAVDKKVAQLGNFNPLDYLYGGLLGVYNMKVKILKASKSPAIVEAAFEGTLEGVRGDKITLTEGKFYYKE